MKKFSTWLILALAVVYWILRIIATYTSMMGMDFMIKPLDTNTEISLLFIALLSFVLIAKRKWLGAIIYLVAYEGYFGFDLYRKFSSIVAGTLSADAYMNIFFSFIGVVLPIVVLFDLMLDQNRKDHPTDKKTDWFYKNQKFDRQMDERTDKNNYRTL
jgi:hypothetical protein